MLDLFELRVDELEIALIGLVFELLGLGKRLKVLFLHNQKYFKNIYPPNIYLVIGQVIF